MRPLASGPLRASGLTASYGLVPVLQGINVEVPEGTIAAILGLNGSGKSTLLKSLCRSIAHVQGEIIMDGREISKLESHELAAIVSYVPQSELPRFGFSVLETVLMARTVLTKGLYESEEDYRIVDSAMERADCRSYAQRRSTELSGGEMQRVLIARALAQQCPYVLLDEPTSHLDMSHRLRTEKLLCELRDEGCTVIVATHDFHTAACVADRIWVLDSGSVALEGDASEVLSSPELDKIYGVRFERISGYSRSPLLVPVEELGGRS